MLPTPEEFLLTKLPENFIHKVIKGVPTKFFIIIQYLDKEISLVIDIFNKAKISNYQTKMSYMEQKFTPLNLTQYLYNETSTSQTLAIEEALCLDNALAAEYETLLTAYEQLPKVTFRPSGKTIQSILSYSACTAVENA